MQCYPFNADIAVIYFSGYGLAIDDGNYLIAADAKLSSVLDSADEFVPLNWILRAAAARKLNLVIVDACRENLFRRVGEAHSGPQGALLGLAVVKLKLHNTLIALAAKSGSVSYDGAGAGRSPVSLARRRRTNRRTWMSNSRGSRSIRRRDGQSR